MKSSEVLIAEFEARRSAERQARRSKMLGRGFEVATWWIGCVFCFVWLMKKEETAASLLPIILSGFITESLRKRWKLEDRVAELEHRAREEPIQAAETTRGK